MSEIKRPERITSTKINHFVIDESKEFFEEKEKRTKNLKFFINFFLEKEPEYKGTEFQVPEEPKKKKIVRMIEQKFKKLKNNLF